MKNIYLLKDLARLSGLSVHTVKYYLRLGLFKEFGRSPETNFRYFDDANVHQLNRIKQLRAQRKTLKDIKQLLKG